MSDHLWDNVINRLSPLTWRSLFIERAQFLYYLEDFSFPIVPQLPPAGAILADFYMSGWHESHVLYEDFQLISARSSFSFERDISVAGRIDIVLTTSKEGKQLCYLTSRPFQFIDIFDTRLEIWGNILSHQSWPPEIRWERSFTPPTRIHFADDPLLELTMEGLPELIQMDSVNLMHCAVVVDTFLARPDLFSISPWHIAFCPLTELQRQAIEQYGYEKFINETMDQHTESCQFNGRDYTLYFCGANSDIVFLAVQDASTDRRYFLRVPPNFRDPLAALEWTFNLPGDYIDGLEMET